VNVYAHISPGVTNPKWSRDPSRVYVPNSLSNTVSEIDPATYKVTRTFPVGAEPNHVTPSWDGAVLWVNDTAGNTLTPVSPVTGRPGRPVPVEDPYNLYFTPDGQHALVMAEALNRIDFRDPVTMRLRHSMRIPTTGVNHMDFTADGQYALASCEFSGSVVWIELGTRRVVGKLTLGMSMSAPMTAPGPGYAMPQDVRLSADGKLFYVADMAANGVWLIDTHQSKPLGFLHTGAGTHGFEVARDGRRLFVSNRGEGSVSVIDMTVNRVVGKWRIPGGGSPDMGGISADGKVMWWGGRYNGVVYAMSTWTDGCSRRSRSDQGRMACASSPSPAATPSATPATSADLLNAAAPSAADEDVQVPRPVHALDPDQLDVAGGRWAGDQRVRPRRIQPGESVGDVGGHLPGADHHQVEVGYQGQRAAALAGAVVKDDRAGLRDRHRAASHDAGDPV
jgi:YVTN family beta-propeller protein